MTWDADPHHLWAVRYRIPRIPTPYPDWRYEVALCVPGPPRADHLYGAIEPTEPEAHAIGCYIDYRREYYREGWRARMLERPFDVDDTTNTVVLLKTERGWQYRRASFRHGPVPAWDDPKQADFPPTLVGLLALLDHINHDSNGWKQWKTDHEELNHSE